MRGSNPTFREGALDRIGITGGDTTASFSINGVIWKSAFLLLLVIAGAGFTWQMVQSNPGQPEIFMPWLIGSLIAGFVLGLIISFKPNTAPALAPVYAVVEGVFLGAISSFLNLQFPGIAMQAVTITLGVFVAMLMAYRAGLIKATEKFKSVIVACTIGIMIAYGLSLLLRLFGTSMPFIHESGPIGIGFSLFCVTIASLNLIIDFDFIENMEAQRVPKSAEWYASFGLLVTLVWLYIEILRLLSKLRND